MKLDKNLEHLAPQPMVSHLVYIHNKGHDVYFQSEFFKISACSKVP